MRDHLCLWGISSSLWAASPPAYLPLTSLESILKNPPKWLDIALEAAGFAQVAGRRFSHWGKRSNYFAFKHFGGTHSFVCTAVGCACMYLWIHVCEGMGGYVHACECPSIAYTCMLNPKDHVWCPPGLLSLPFTWRPVLANKHRTHCLRNLAIAGMLRGHPVSVSDLCTSRRAAMPDPQSHSSHLHDSTLLTELCP